MLWMLWLLLDKTIFVTNIQIYFSSYQFNLLDSRLSVGVLAFNQWLSLVWLLVDQYEYLVPITTP